MERNSLTIHVGKSKIWRFRAELQPCSPYPTRHHSNEVLETPLDRREGAKCADQNEPDEQGQKPKGNECGNPDGIHGNMYFACSTLLRKGLASEGTCYGRSSLQFKHKAR